jgi:acyl carrier protein
MTRQDIEKKVTDILVNILDVEPEEVKSEANFRDELGGDSLDLVEVMMAVEHEFRISVTDEEADQVNTVADIIGLVEKHQK